jgi:hypothetical protein
VLGPEIFGAEHSTSFFTTLQISKCQYGKIIKMERRRSKRKTIRLAVEIILGSVRCPGFIENLSVNGLFMRTSPEQTSIDVIPGTTFEIQLQHATGKTMDLHCRALWSYKNPPHGETHSIGMEIINPSPEYTAFIDTLK